MLSNFSSPRSIPARVTRQLLATARLLRSLPTARKSNETTRTGKQPGNTPGRSLLLLLLGTLAGNPAVSADELVMTNGDRLSGTIHYWDQELFEFETPYAGTLTIDWEQVRELTTDKPVTVLLTNDNPFTGLLTYKANGNLVIEVEGQPLPLSLQVGEVAYINPEPWRLGIAARKSGEVNFSFKADRGNTESNELDLDFSYNVRRKHDRFSFFGDWEHNTAAGETTKDKWVGLGKYEQFLTGKEYFAFNALVEHDDGKGIDLRHYLGPALGYQFWESERKNLRAEWGVYWTKTDLVGQPAQSALGTGWFLDYDQFIYEDHLQFYHRQSALLSKKQNMNFKSKTGLRLPLSRGFLASAEIEANWDGEIAATADNTEVITRVKLGYGW